MLKKAKKRSKSMEWEPAATRAMTSAAALPGSALPGCRAAMAACTSCLLSRPSPLASRCLPAKHCSSPDSAASNALKQRPGTAGGLLLSCTAAVGTGQQRSEHSSPIT